MRMTMRRGSCEGDVGVCGGWGGVRVCKWMGV